MKYFKLSQDKRIPHGVNPTELHRMAGYHKFRSGDLSGLDDTITLTVTSNQVNYYPDILDQQLFMVRGAVKQVFDLFLPGNQYQTCFLLDHDFDRFEYYHIPVLEIIDIPEGITRNQPIFRIAGAEEIAVAASIEVVEAVLRRRPSGVRISPIN